MQVRSHLCCHKIFSDSELLKFSELLSHLLMIAFSLKIVNYFSLRLLLSRDLISFLFVFQVRQITITIRYSVQLPWIIHLDELF